MHLALNDRETSGDIRPWYRSDFNEDGVGVPDEFSAQTEDRVRDPWRCLRDLHCVSVYRAAQHEHVRVDGLRLIVHNRACDVIVARGAWRLVRCCGDVHGGSTEKPPA